MSDKDEFINWAVSKGYSKLTATKIWCVINIIKRKGISNLEELNQWLHHAAISKTTKSKYRYSFRMYLEWIKTR